MKNLITTFQRLTFPFILILVSGCAIHVYHHYPEGFPGVYPAPNTGQSGGGGTVVDLPGKGTITFVNDPDVKEDVKIERTTKNNPQKVLVGRLASDDVGSSIKLAANVGDRFYFEVEGAPNLKIDSYPVEKLEQTHTLKVTNIRWMHARKSYKTVPNAQASRMSYDIFYLAPEEIDLGKNEGGGSMKQIFAELADTDVDWHRFDGDYATKRHFSFNTKDQGSGNEITTSVYTKHKYKESFSLGIGISAGIPGIGSLSRNLGYSSSTSTQRARNEVYSYRRKDHLSYRIDLVEGEVALHKNFKEAVKMLGTPLSLVSDTNQAKLDPSYAAYENFIREWGTHYPTQVSYGGYYLGYSIKTMEQVIEEKSKGWKYDEEVNVQFKKVEAGRKTSIENDTEESFERKSTNSSSGYMYKGGSGGFGSWSVGDDVQPIGLQLKRLDTLLRPELFKGEISEEELALKQNMLEKALAAYIKSVSDNGVTKRPRTFRMRFKDMENVGGDRLKLYGKLFISYYKGNDPLLSKSDKFILYRDNEVDSDEIYRIVRPSHMAQDKNVFSRTEDNYLDFARGASYNLGSTEMAITLNPRTENNIDLSQHSFILHGYLADKYSGASNAAMGESIDEKSDGKEYFTSVKALRFSDFAVDQSTPNAKGPFQVPYKLELNFKNPGTEYGQNAEVEVWVWEE